MTGNKRIAARHFFGWLIGLMLAVLAFSQAAASVGLAIEGFRPLGAGFFSWRSGQTRAAVGIFDSRDKNKAKRAIEAGRSQLVLAPLTPRSLWLIGKGQEINGKIPEARRAMEQAEKISRRDGAVQLWLGGDKIRSGAIAPGLRNFDLLIRSDRDAGSTMMPRLALVVLAPQAHQYLRPYINEKNPWLAEFLQVAATNLPRAAPLATLLAERGKMAPDVEHARSAYTILMGRLIRERSYPEAMRLYPLLPGANPKNLRDITAVGNGQIGEGYPPFVWSFAENNSYGGEVIATEDGGTGFEVFGSPGTVGIAAEKLIAPGRATRLQWRIDDRSTNLQGSANWGAACLAGKSAGTAIASINLLDESVPLKRNMIMNLPAGCDLLKIDMRIAGGIGRDQARVIVSGLKLVSDIAPR